MGPGHLFGNISESILKSANPLYYIHKNEGRRPLLIYRIEDLEMGQKCPQTNGQAPNIPKYFPNLNQIKIEKPNFYSKTNKIRRPLVVRARTRRGEGLPSPLPLSQGHF